MENLNRALSENTQIPLTSDEFQNMLRAWFEEKGIMSDLRSQVRFKMINVLKNTVIGRDINKKSSATTSLSTQIINSIVAEHLIQNKYQYTMSIFNTEALITNIFPNYPSVFNSTNAVVDENENKSFDKENILNVLELAGISKSSRVCEDILKMYGSDVYKKSLLECLFSSISTVATWTRPESADKLLKSVDLTNEPNLIKQVANCLVEYDFTLQNFKKIIDKLKTLYISDIENIEKQFLLEINSLKKKISSQENKIKTMHKEKKYSEVKLHKMYEDYKILKSYVDKLLIEKDHSQQQNEAKIENDLIKENPDVEKNFKICIQEHCTDLCKRNTSSVESLRSENYELKKQNCYQKEEITSLTKRYNDLLRSLSDCQSKINLLNSRIDGDSTKLLNTLIVQENLEIPQFKLEKTFEVSDDSSDTVTEAILRETRLRLKTLEEESKKVEEKCFSYLIK